jgi:hypothetical protein
MRILYYWAEQNNFMFQWQRIHIFDELERKGHVINVFNPLNFESIELANECLIKYLKNNQVKYDIFMTCEGSDVLFSHSVRQIRILGLRSMLICFDNLHAPFMHKKIAHIFDLVWLTSRETEDMFRRWGCHNIVSQTYAANPFQFNAYRESIDYAVCFIGSPYGGRANKLNLLTKSEVFCKVYSDIFSSNNYIVNKKSKLDLKEVLKQTVNAAKFEIGRKVILGSLINKYASLGGNVLQKSNYLMQLPSVNFVDMQKIYSQSALSLNITELRNTYALKNPVHKIHLRTFEIPMSGGLEIASYSEELAEYFTEDKEIVLYRSDEEFISKAKFYLNSKNENLIFKIKKNARSRAASEHTWTNRFNVVFSKLLN